MVRLPKFYMMFIIFPMTLLMGLYPLIFIIPPDSGERLGYGLTIMLSITVYLLVISDKLPETSNSYSMLGICFSALFALMAVSLICSLITIRISRYTKTPYNFLMYLTKLRCTLKVKPNGKVKNQQEATCGIKFDTEDENKNFEIMKYKEHKNAMDVDSAETLTDEENNKAWKAIANTFDKAFLGMFFIFLLVFSVGSFGMFTWILSTLYEAGLSNIFFYYYFYSSQRFIF